jgi:hypothetical protein
MGKVILFNGITKLDLDPDMVLENCKGNLEGVVLLGWDKEGGVIFLVNLRRRWYRAVVA